MAKARKSGNSPSAATLGFEQKLWATADALRNNMDAAEYKHVILGLIFLKYISDAFVAKYYTTWRLAKMNLVIRDELLKDDQCWAYGLPSGDANFAWVQHCVRRRPGSRIPRGQVTRGLGVV